MESFNPSRGLPLPAPRLALQRRIPSDSSEASHASNISHASEDQFVFSPVSTPAGENPPSQAMTSGGATKTSAARDRLLLGKGTLNRIFCCFLLYFSALARVSCIVNVWFGRCPSLNQSVNSGSWARGSKTLQRVKWPSPAPAVRPGLPPGCTAGPGPMFLTAS